MVDSISVELPDFSEWLTEDRFRNEENEWAKTRFYERNAQAILEVKPPTLLEVGCGSGWVPWQLREMGFGCAYAGLDAQLLCIQAAHIRNPGVMFVLDDIRSLPKPGFHAVCAFAVLKHFGLHEWEDVFLRFLACAPVSIFTMQIASTDFDDGTEYHHTWIRQSRLENAIRTAGHMIVKQEVAVSTDKGDEVYVWTKANSKPIYVPGSPHVNKQKQEMSSGGIMTL